MKTRMLSEFSVNPVSSIYVSENNDWTSHGRGTVWTDMPQTAFQAIVGESRWSVDDCFLIQKSDVFAMEYVQVQFSNI